MGKEILTRRMLYDLVWSVPMTTLSKKYAISDVGLRKVCIRMNIPMPQSGHWQKLQFGKKIKRVILDANYKGDNEVSLELRTHETKENLDEASLEKQQQQLIELELKSLLSVPEKLTNPHQLIFEAKENLNNRDRYEDKGLINPGRGILNIKVSRANIARALRFMDTLIKTLESRGHFLEIRNGKTNVVIEGQQIEVQFREKLRKEIVKGERWNTANFLPTGLLAFQINGFNNKEWKDGTVQIEDQLSKILARLEKIGQEKKLRELERIKEKEINEAKEKIRKDYEQRKAQDLKYFKDTLSKASRWHKATNLRNYIDEVEAKAIADNSLNDDSKKWLAWARKKADWYDPFIEKEDELLTEIDRETLEPIKNVYTLPWLT